MTAKAIVEHFYVVNYIGLGLLSGFICSMSGKGNCYDNAAMESFYHTLKAELVSGQRYRTRGEAQTSIFDYSKIFYNRERLHSNLDYQPPEPFDWAA